MTEQQIQKKITTYLESKNVYVVKVVSATKSGVPDILACYNGIFIGIEVKTPKTQKNVSKIQEYNLQKIREAGGVTLVAWELEQVKELLDFVGKTR